MTKPDNLLKRTTQKSGKFYNFNDTQNRSIPSDHWFQKTPEGECLFIVFYSLACRYSKCLGCNLPMRQSSTKIPYHFLMEQVDYLFDILLTSEKKTTLAKIILSNNGSVLDQETFSTTSLIYFFARMNRECPQLKVITLETRPEYVDIHELEVINRALQEKNPPARLEIAIGFEAFDEKIRNEHFHKGMSLGQFEKMVALLAPFQFKIKTYFMLKPIENLSDEQAFEDICKAMDYLENISKKFKISINMHLNPTYVARGTPLERAYNQGRYAPPSLKCLLKTISYGKSKGISIYIGLYDEGLAVPGGTMLPLDSPYYKILEEFNQKGEFSKIENLIKKLS